jgi:hypothetical protein
MDQTSRQPSRPAAGEDLARWRGRSAEDGTTLRRFLAVVALFSAIAIGTNLVLWLVNATDYVGIDPDDAMRLVEVRDLLGGQGWFDLHQYRLGPDGGTLMHWSRLIDAPIAALITLYGWLLAPQAAEAAALATWPLLLIVPLIASTALASYRLGGQGAMLIGLILAAVFLAAIVRFRPGAIDHHNLQLVLVTFIAAMLVDPLARAWNFAAAAVAGAVALAIGAETTPLVAVAAIAVSLLWAVNGATYRRAAIGFGLTFAAATGLLFFGTTPASLWGNVTCDTLSVGYLALSAVGGLVLAGSALAVTDRSLPVRLAALGITGIALLGLALVVAPECLQNPLNGLDPLLKTYWISTVREAQSLSAELASNPENIGTFYAVGMLSAAVCLMRILRGELVAAHAVLLGLIAVSWLVSVVQVRGMLFANYLAFVPLSALVADLRRLYLARRNDVRAATAFALSALLSVPSVWSIVGVLAFDPVNALAGVTASNASANANANDSAGVCVDAASVHDFAARPPGRIVASFNEGPALLRFTPHSVLGANYHRNQRGMVASIRIGMAKPQDALQRLEASGVRYILTCDGDPMADDIARDYPSGLFAALKAGDIPGYLEEIPSPGRGIRIYEIIQR